MNLKSAFAAVALFVIAWPLVSSASESPLRVTGIYSDLSYNDEGGDLLGTEIFIVGTGDGYVAFVQHWEGGSTLPVMVPVKIVGNSITFCVPAPSIGEGTYEGRISSNGFDGTWVHILADGQPEKDALHLKRKQSYWQ